jgi:hypothetical protein
MPSLHAAAVVAVHIVSQVAGSSAPADDTPKHARSGETVTLSAVIETGGKQHTWYTDAGATIVVGGKKHKTKPLADAPSNKLTWYKVEPTAENMSNTSSGDFAFEKIAYQAVELDDQGGKSQIEADVRPTLTPDRGGGLGTMRYQLRATISDGGDELTTAGIDARRGRGSGGLTDGVHRVSIRRDDSYVGWLTEMYGQPYIWASAGLTDRTHQSERLEGADCADFVVYGWRRLGHDVEYTWTEGLRKYTKKLTTAEAREDGVYVDGKGRPVPFPKVGDLVLFPRHVGVLVEDRGTIGVLDTADILAHTLYQSAHEEAISDINYTITSIEVLRWKE